MSSNILGGYSVCTTIGRTQSITINLIDKKSPSMGVIVEMWHQGPEMNCSLSVSVICDSKNFKLTRTWNFGAACLIEFGIHLRHWFEDLEDPLKITGAPALLLTFDFSNIVGQTSALTGWRKFFSYTDYSFNLAERNKNPIMLYAYFFMQQNHISWNC
ncbi:hypothetical protein HanPI659440_Chr08g0292891 [Helianthus annuus]|nr:hypothetical protein HanPI659440_Chr08g0292891 [Helianthus annuus]